MNNTCWDSNDGVIIKETNYTNNGSVHKVSNLRPYWFYNITVSASTEVGEGPAGWCDDCYFRTKTSSKYKNFRFDCLFTKLHLTLCLVYTDFV
jgi:hypothetical protein